MRSKHKCNYRKKKAPARGKITNYARLLIAKKESGYVYFGPPVSRKSCGSKSRYDVCGMGKKSGYLKNKRGGKSQKPASQASVQAAILRDPCLSHYYIKHGAFSVRTSGEGATVILPTNSSHKKPC
jgi:hypothetical protein